MVENEVLLTSVVGGKLVPTAISSIWGVGPQSVRGKSPHPTPTAVDDISTRYSSGHTWEEPGAAPAMVLEQFNNCLAPCPPSGPLCLPGECKALGQPCLCLAAARGSGHRETVPAEPEVIVAWMLCGTGSRDIQLHGTSVITLKCSQTPSAFVAENRAEVLPY